MPYNTRRKSLSLPSLGIHVPVTHAARDAARAAAALRASSKDPSSTSSSSSSSSSAMSPPSRPDSQQPNKKLKRSHSEDSESPLPSAPLRRKRDDAIKLENTPPPSPHDSRASIELDDVDVDSEAPVMKTIDLEGINDEIVEAVIVQLQNTGNRPHLVKELTAILMPQLKIVQQSANPCAIISSRLSTYMKRPCWSALAPCPLTKELENIHPRRTYFYLTTGPHQPLPGPSTVRLTQRTIISPSLSSATSGSEDADPDRRRELSPSPEVDLSSPEFDDMDDDVAMPTTPIGSLSVRFPLPSAVLSPRHHRGASPPLEKDEREFTQTADGLQKRKLSGDLLSAELVDHRMDLDDGSVVRDDILFGEAPRAANAGLLPSSMTFVTSPAMRPSFPLNLRKDGEAESWSKLDNVLEWDRSPENIALEELDGLLIDF